MTRPRKQNVDYFPHVCRHGKTLQLIEQRYGNDGYALWFKTLELLGDTEGHYLDCRDVYTWEYFITKMRLDEVKCIEILDLLARLKAIDTELWSKNRVIWSDNFVSGIADVYKKRYTEIPLKPCFRREKSGSRDENLGSRDENPQRKEKKNKQEERIGEKRKEEYATPPPDGSGDAPSEPPEAPIPPELRFSCKHFVITEEYFDELVKDYPGLSPAALLMELKKMRDWLDDNPNRHKRTAKGHLKNPKNFIRNWLSRTVVNPRGSPRGNPNERTARNVKTLKRFMGEGNG